MAADLAPDVLVKNRWMQLTRADYEAALARIPERQRFEFAMGRKRVQSLLNNLLVTMTLAAQARAHGITPSPPAKPRDEMESLRALAAAELDRVARDATTEFDARSADFEAKARETYHIDRERFRTPAAVRVSEIAVTAADRGEAEAHARAREARARIAAGEDFADIARRYSDATQTSDQGPALTLVPVNSLAPIYAMAVSSLSRVGDVSEPFEWRDAYRIVRLEERRPSRLKTFDEVRESIMAMLRQRYVGEAQDRRIQSIHGDPELLVNQQAIDALVNRADLRPATPASPASSASSTAR